MWTYPDFLKRAEAAYHALEAPVLKLPPSFNGFERRSTGRGRAALSLSDARST